MPRHLLVLLVPMAVLAGGGAACGLHRGDRPTAPVDAAAGQAVVTRVIDGDTIVARLGDEEETIRLIGIDTPETKRPGTPVECFGPEAAAHLKALLPDGSVIRLERDATERDRYGRLLAYVHRTPDDVFVNLDLVAGGYATAYRIPPNVARTDELAAAAGEARRQGLGLWAACGGGHVPLPP